jgi:hypothetical protein
MNFEFINIRGDVIAPDFGGQCGLLDREECCGKKFYAMILLKSPTGLKSFPRAGNFYTKLCFKIMFRELGQ